MKKWNPYEKIKKKAQDESDIVSDMVYEIFKSGPEYVASGAYTSLEHLLRHESPLAKELYKILGRLGECVDEAYATAKALASELGVDISDFI